MEKYRTGLLARSDCRFKAPVDKEKVVASNVLHIFKDSNMSENPSLTNYLCIWIVI